MYSGHGITFLSGGWWSMPEDDIECDFFTIISINSVLL